MERADLEQWKAREVARLLALVETERRYYQEIVASIPVGLLVLSPDLSIMSANRAVRKIFGLRSGDALRGKLDALLPEWVLERVSEVLKTGVSQTNILVDQVKGDQQRLRVGILPIRNWDDEGEAEALLSIEDLTAIETTSQLSLPLAAEPVSAEAPVTAASSELVDNVDGVLWTLELNPARFAVVSARAFDLLGFPAEHWTGNVSFWMDRVHPLDRDWVVQSYQQAIERGQEHTCEFRAITADGRIKWLRESARPMLDSGGRVKRVYGVTVDVTQRHLLQDQIVQAERIEAISKLSARLAHDLNNMLMIVTGYGEELLNSLPEGSSSRGDVQEILTATERMNALTSQLLAFARRATVPTSTVELETLLGTVQQYLRVLLGDDIGLELKMSQETNRVKADASQLEQIIASLVERLREGAKGTGSIRIETSRVEIVEDLRRDDAPLKPGAYGVIAISGSGQPFEGDSKSSLFESVLPGKEPWDDSAAAVTRSYGTVRQWGGDIAVGTVAEGRVLRVFLPLVEEITEKEIVPVPVESAPAEPAPHRETILVVEDEPGIRALVRKILRRQGYEVLEASNGDEALALGRQHSGHIQLLITDVIMPEVGGRELVDRFHELRRDTKVLYVSGYTDDASIYAGNYPPGTAFLQKPFTLGALLDKVKEVLGSA